MASDVPSFADAMLLVPDGWQVMLCHEPKIEASNGAEVITQWIGKSTIGQAIMTAIDRIHAGEFDGK